jgi:endonuclease/exonuclease/phosphatase family metal-dependent hydrolase
VRRFTVLLLILAAGCRTGFNYTNPEGPRYAGVVPVVARDSTRLKVVSFNIEFSREVDRAIAFLETNPALRGADLILLQEMNERATRRIAAALGLGYIYYPAIYHYRTHQLFGNAILSRWPILEDRKIVLPHLSRFVRTQRIATAATIQVGSSRVRVYSTHLGTPGAVGSGGRRDQLRAILKDASRYSRVIIGGDMNDARVGEVTEREGFVWPTAHTPPTSLLGRIDHIFLKGFSSPDSLAAGTVVEAGGASDHLPVWAIAVLE